MCTGNIDMHNKIEDTANDLTNTPGASRYEVPIQSVQTNWAAIECLKQSIVAMQKENLSMKTNIKEMEKELRSNEEMQKYGLASSLRINQI